jgi:hypothetical protein
MREGRAPIRPRSRGPAVAGLLAAAAASTCVPAAPIPDDPPAADEPSDPVAGARPLAGPSRDVRVPDAQAGAPAAAGDGGPDARGSAPPAPPVPPADRVPDAGVASGGVAAGDGGRDGRPADPSILPVLLVEVGGATIRRGDKTPGTLRVIEDHDGTLNGVSARPASLQTPIGIEHRGAWSLQFPKKSFSLELRDGAGNDRDLPFLGFPADSDWVLRAGYYDHTLVRDALGFAMFRDIWGRYAPRARFVELFIDGQYFGVFLACEKIKRGRHRVDLPKVAPDAASGDLTGGYLVHLESGGTGPGFKTSTGRVWDYGYPRGVEITPPQASYIRDFMDRFERAMAAPDFAHPTAGYARWVDMPSWIDFALFQELARNTDGYTKSSYYQKLSDAAGGKLVKGPVWDNDLSYGNLNNGTQTPEGWLYEFRWNIPVPWWEKLWREPRFRSAAACRWRELRRTRLTTAAIDATIDELAAALVRAQPRENARWKLIGRRESLHAYVGATWAEDLRYLKGWIARRLSWLDAGLAGACQAPPG